MNEELVYGGLSRYPAVVQNALRDVGKSCGAGKTFVKPDTLTKAERAAEIIDDCVDTTEDHKTELMTASVLAYLDEWDNPKAYPYTSRVTSIVLDIRHGLDPRLCGGASKDVLRVCTANRIAEYEYLLVILRRNNHDLDALLRMRARLTAARRALDRSAFADIGAGRLQAFEGIIYRSVLTEIENKIIRASGDNKDGVLPLRPFFKRLRAVQPASAPTSDAAQALPHQNRSSAR